MGNGFLRFFLSREATSADCDWPPGTNSCHCRGLGPGSRSSAEMLRGISVAAGERCIWGISRRLNIKCLFPLILIINSGVKVEESCQPLKVLAVGQ